MRSNKGIGYGLLIAFTCWMTGCHSIQSRPSREGGLADLLGLQRRGEEDFQDQLVTSADPLGARAFNRLLVDDLSADNIATTLKVRTTFKEDRPAAEQAYKQGQSLYEQAVAAFEDDANEEDHVALFRQAANSFRLAAGKFPDSQIEHDSLYFEGESYFFANNYVQANRAFENLITRYAGTRYLDKVQARRFSIAEYWLKLAQNGAGFALNDPSRPSRGLASEARRIFHRIRLDDPTGKLADDATVALGNAYFAEQKWLDAADAYEDLRNNYPGSRHLFHAHLFELRARLSSYQGYSYDATPLKKADEIMRRIVQQFPQQAREEQEFLAKEAANIRHLLAERDWGMAKFFEKKGENLAAKFYYNEVTENFADTQFAAAVNDELKKIEGRPDEPEQYAQWFVDLFPDNEPKRPVIASNPASLLK